MVPLTAYNNVGMNLPMQL